MELIAYIKEIKKNPCRILIGVLFRFPLLQEKLSDVIYMRIVYKGVTMKNLDIDTPITFNEKLQWLKLYDRNPEYTKLVDKYVVKEYVADLIGEEYIIPTLGVWEHFDEIDFAALPEQFVLKCTHDSGGVIIVKDKANFDKKAAKKKIEKSLRRNYFYSNREWPYKNVKPRIIAEKYMVDETGTELKDYKVFCFSGEPKLIQVDYNRFTGHKRNLYNIDWEYVPASIQYPTDPEHQISRPEKLEKLLELASILAKDYPHVRVDFYSIHDKLYFGEITFYHGAGLEKFEPEEFGVELGSWIKLPIDSKKASP